jgi:hypothetical protein
MKLWTVGCDHFATGEGRTLAAWIGYADTQDKAIERFAEKFESYFAEGSFSEEGVSSNAVVSSLFAPAALDSFRKYQGVAFIDAASSVHINLS